MLFDAIGCAVLLGIVLLCVVQFDLGALTGASQKPLTHLGAELGAPADPAEAYSAARPEWYYLFLFQLLKYFPGKAEIIGAIVIPGAVMTLLAIMPVRVAALLAAVTLSVAVVRLAMLMLLALARTAIIEALPLVRPGLHIVAARE